MSSKSEKTRQRVMEITLKLLESGEGQRVRMSDIASGVGITRQALYLHFPSRGELLMAATQYLDEIHQSDQRLAASRTAGTGTQRLEAFVIAWGNFIPDIYGVAKALLAMKDTDEVAAAVWEKRMKDMKEGCSAAIIALSKEGRLSSEFSVGEATDLMWSMLSVRQWELLTQECGWSQTQYITAMRQSCERLLIN